MLRLIAVLLVAIYAAMSIWGDSPGGSVAVSRAETAPPATPVLARAPAAETAGMRGLVEITEAQAVRMAIEATNARAAATPVEAVAAAVQPRAEAATRGEVRYVTGSRVNLRAAPTTNSAIVGGVSQGDRAELLSDPGDNWVRIRTDAGIEAWIFSRFLSEAPA